MSFNLHFSLIIILFFLNHDYFQILDAKNIGLSFNLIHRDSPLSPLYNPYETPMERLNKAFKYSITRLNHLNPSSSISNDPTPEGPVISDNGQYIVKYSIGSTRTQFYGLVDTGSDLFWTQCKPCISCYHQISTPWDPTTSVTYKNIACSSKQCKMLDHTCSGGNDDTCTYTYAYGGGSYTVGSLALDTLTLDSTSGEPVFLPNIIFGCGHNNSGFDGNPSGIFGLGGGPLSLVSQIGSITGSTKYSQCLVPFHTDPSISSKIHFGSDAEVSGPGVASTSLISKDDKTYYFVTVEGFSIGKTFIPYNTTVMEGNMFIDSGTPPMLLPQDLYFRVEAEVKKAIPMEPIQNSQPQLCYKSENEIDAPIITTHFRGGANVELTPTNSFIRVGDDVYCFTMTNITGDVGIFGNYAQVNFLIGFDIGGGKVSFKPTDCTKQ